MDINQNLGKDTNSGSVAVGTSGHVVPLKVIQAVFSEITSKDSSLTQEFRKNYQIDFNAIEQLNTKIIQTMKTYNIEGLSASYVICYINNSKDEFPKFEEFKKLSANSSKQVESIYIKYDFLIKNPSSTEFQTYTLTLRILSHIAMINKSDFPKMFFLLGGANAVLKISYKDYIIARAFKTTVADWFETIKCDDEYHFIKFLQKISFIIPNIMRLLSINSFLFNK